jgi:hypothetical protein
VKESLCRFYSLEKYRAEPKVPLPYPDALLQEAPSGLHFRKGELFLLRNGYKIALLSLILFLLKEAIK